MSIPTEVAEALIQQLLELGEEARRKALQGPATGYPPGYWYGVRFGLETAAAELKALLAHEEKGEREDGEGPPLGSAIDPRSFD